MRTPSESEPTFVGTTLARVIVFIIVAMAVRGALARLLGVG